MEKKLSALKIAGIVAAIIAIIETELSPEPRIRNGIAHRIPSTISTPPIGKKIRMGLNTITILMIWSSVSSAVIVLMVDFPFLRGTKG